MHLTYIHTYSMSSAGKSNETEGMSDDAKAAHYNASGVFKVPPIHT